MRMIGRRAFVSGAGALTALAAYPLSAKNQKLYANIMAPRSRVMMVNDLAGDPDGLFAAAHALLSPSIEMRGLVGSFALGPEQTSERARFNADQILKLMGVTGKVPTFVGAEKKMTDAKAPMPSAGAQAIINEALRTDTKLPLYVAVGGGLTDVASALLIEPRITDKFTLIWIGGNGLVDGVRGEYNYGLDPIAAQSIFNVSTVALWQVSSAVYGDCLVSRSELEAQVAPFGKIGRWMCDRLDDAAKQMEKYRLNTGETWILGDSPLVHLTALTDWVPNRNGWTMSQDRTASSDYKELFVPRILPDGSFEMRIDGRMMRHYTSIDTRTMFGDFFAKMKLAYG